jgi:hypothetical protein
MSSITAPIPTRRIRTPLPRFALFATIAALIAVVGFGLWTTSRGNSLPGVVTTQSAFEEKWGIHISHIAVVADGGLLDFRFQVIDPDKAAPVMEVETRPHLYVEETGYEVSSLYHIMHNHDIPAGESHYLIYNNSNGAIKSGTSVSVVLGDMRLEHIIAQ